MTAAEDPQLLGDMLERISRVLGRARVGVDRFRRGENGRFVYYTASARPWCLYASYTGLHVSWLLDLTSRWPASRLHASLELLLDHQRPADGRFHCPVCAVDPVDPRQTCQERDPVFSAGVTWKIADLLAALGQKSRHAIAPPTPEELPDPPDDWLEQTFTKWGPYSGGSRVGHLAGLRGWALRQAGQDPADDPLIRRIHNWLVDHQDSNGFFGASDDLANGMNGLLKMRRNLFDGIGLAVPNPRRIVRSIFSLQKSDGRFGGACEDWNASTLLISCGLGQTDLRGRITETLAKVAAAIETKQDELGLLAFEPGQEGWLVPTNVQVQCLRGIQGFCEFLRTL